MAKPRRSANDPAPSGVGFAVSRSVNDMAGDELKAYARKIGVTERDVQGLSEMRLRQNCLVMVHEVLDSI